MTKNIDLRKYKTLLVEMLPTSIKSKSEHRRYRSIIGKLIMKGEDRLSPEETEILRLLMIVAADYEKNLHGVKPLEPHILLRTLLEDNFMKQKDLLPIFKTEGAISAVVSGKRPLSREKAVQLGALFHIDYKLFL